MGSMQDSFMPVMQQIAKYHGDRRQKHEKYLGIGKVSSRAVRLNRRDNQWEQEQSQIHCCCHDPICRRNLIWFN